MSLIDAFRQFAIDLIKFELKMANSKNHIVHLMNR